jgi:hypothetical protein
MTNGPIWFVIRHAEIRHFFPPAILIGKPVDLGFTKSRILPIFFSRPPSPHAEISYRTDTF